MIQALILIALFILILLSEYADSFSMFYIITYLTMITIGAIMLIRKMFFKK
jgi:hypothetical protein